MIKTEKGSYVKNIGGGWKVVLNGKLLSPIWQDKGGALAGLEVEARRAAKRLKANN